MRKRINDNWEFKKENENWQSVRLPHDAMLANGRSPHSPAKSAAGFFCGGRFAYKKSITLSQEDLEKYYTLEFEGVYKNAVVSVNGKKAGGCAYGYLPFEVALNPYLVCGSNTIIVEADNANQPDSRWYSGAGIYRSVWLNVQEKKRLLPKSIRISTKSLHPPILEVQAEHLGGQVRVEVYAGEDKQCVAAADGDCVSLEIPHAQLWSHNNPYLYDVAVKLIDGHVTVEETHISYGIRMVAVKREGLFVNGEPVLLKGGCIHHDNGILGACEYEESAERKIRKLKENGFNAIRSAHNPCSEAILQACDKYGIYLMDETWDMWYGRKSKYDYANEFQENYIHDIEAIVAKDYNHPSVILYSIGNEVSEPAEERGVLLTRELVDLFHKLDATRPVTAGFNLMIIANAAKGKRMYREDGGLDASQSKDMSGMNSTMFNMIASMTGSGMNRAANGKKADLAVSPALSYLDIAGYNYASGRYAKDAKLHPQRLIIGSETFSQDIAGNWEMVESMPNVIGDFLWTAWDYLGEAGLGAWSFEKDAQGFSKPYPWLLADTGVFDILGNPNGEALWVKAVWTKNTTPEIAVQPCNHEKEKLVKAVWRGTNSIPSWSWSHCDGNRTAVEVYGNGDFAELYINDRKVGSRKIKQYKATFKVKYEPGTLKAVLYSRDKCKIGEQTLMSGIGKVQAAILWDEKAVAPDTICYLDVVMQSENGIVDCNSDTKLSVQVENGQLLGFGSANPRTEESFLEGTYSTYYGRAQAVVRAGLHGKTKVTVKSGDCMHQISIPIG